MSAAAAAAIESARLRARIPATTSNAQLGTRELQPQTLRYRGCQAGTLSDAGELVS